jgi:hypothetical protein
MGSYRFEDFQDRPLRRGLLYAVALALLFEAAFGFANFGCSLATLRAFAILWFTAGCAFFIGGISGFVFGIPKTGADDREQDTLSPGTPPPSGAPHGLSRTLHNTNLEEISDWLTKIIVGLSLAEAKPIGDHLWYASTTIGQAVGGASDGGASVVACAGLLYGFVCGFMYYYLWARIWFTRILDMQASPATPATPATLATPPPR